MFRGTHLKDGFTLVEVMVAMALLGLTLGGAVASVTMYWRWNEASSRRIVAVNTARAELELLSRLNYDHAALTVGTHSLMGGAEGTCSVSSIADSSARRKQVAVSVVWRDPRTDTARTETLTTMISEALRP